MLSLEYLDNRGLAWAQATVAAHHYLRAPVLARACPEAWAVCVEGLGPVGCLIVGRPQATRCYPWYGSVGDVATGRAEVTRWQVLNLARVWLSPSVQRGGAHFGPAWLPGYTDRRGAWRSTLASEAIALLAGRVARDYLAARPPVFLDEPYAIRWLLSYCDRTKHAGTIYRASGFALHRTNERRIETWRLALPDLTAEDDAAIRRASEWSPRSRRFRAQRSAAGATLPLFAAS